MLTQVQEAIESLRPVVQADGADLALRGVDEATGVVTVELSVQGYGCSLSATAASLAKGLERILVDRVPGVTAVEQVCGDAAAEACGHDGDACAHHADASRPA